MLITDPVPLHRPGLQLRLIYAVFLIYIQAGEQSAKGAITVRDYATPPKSSIRIIGYK